MKTLEIKNYHVQELNQNELKKVEGGGIGAAIVAGLKIAAVVGTGVAIVGVGALVGYGIYKALT